MEPTNLTGEMLDAWLGSASRGDLARVVLESQAAISLPQARRLATRLAELAPATQTLRLGIVHTFTTDLLDPWLAFESALQGVDCSVYHAPYGFIMQEARSDSGLVQHRPDITVLMLQREDLHPSLGQPLSGLDVAAQEELRDAALKHLQNIVQCFREQVGGLLLVTLLPALAGPGLGLFDAQSERSEAGWWASLKAAIARHLRDKVSSSMFLDLDESVAMVGRSRFFDLRLWYSSRYPFSTVGARETARRIAAVGAVIKHPKVKVIAVDADNTLWGGIIGEDGINGIALGPDYPGNAYLAFQRRLLDLQQRGFVLVICSKNNPADVDEVLEHHPHQLLRARHFVARRVNWESKPKNLASLAEELGLGLDSFVFVDDSDHECAVVRHELPQVEVVQVPRQPIGIARCLERVARLEVLSLTAEDREKTQMYAQESHRRTSQRAFEQGGGDLKEYLLSLQMTMQIGIDDPAQVARLAQLTQKTNQFNLTTRRYTERQIQEFIDSSAYTVCHFSLADTFGNSGVVGLAILHHDSPGKSLLDTFLMSCRVIGRQAESAFLEALLRGLVEQGITAVEAEFLPTAKNALVKDFLPQHGFDKLADGRYRRSLDVNPPRAAADFPVAVTFSATGATEFATAALST